MSDSRMLRAFDARTRKKSWTITHAELTAAATTEDEVLLTVPAGWWIVGRQINVATLFSGGGVGSCTMSIGTAASPALIMTALNVFTGAQTGKQLGSNGTLWMGDHGSNALIARFTVDTTTAALTAGDLTITLLLGNPDANLNF